MYKRKGLPEKGDLVICTIDRTLPHSAFVKLEEYGNLEGMVHDSELSRKWTRNRKSYLKTGRKLVCKVMTTGDNISLSVRRVGPAQARSKQEEWRLENKAHNILTVLAKQLKMSTDDIYDKVGAKILEKEGLIYPFLMNVAKEGESKLKVLNLDKKLSSNLFKLISNRIAVPKVKRDVKLIMKSNGPDGLEIIKKFFKTVENEAEKENSEVKITYCGSPDYKIKIISSDYKKCEKDVTLRTPILIEGLPGIGNVGKLAVDFIIEELKPELIYRIHSFNFPPSVLVKENNLISLPSVSIYRLKLENRDILFLTGDFQPLQEEASYHFSEEVLSLSKKIGCSEIITLGGIGLSESPKKIKIFGTATDEKTLDKYRKLSGVNFNISGKVGAIFGATGLLLGLAPRHGISGLGLLVETASNLDHIALKEAKLLLKILAEAFDLKLDISKFETEMKELEKETRFCETEIEEKLIEELRKQFPKDDMSYIG